MNTHLLGLYRHELWYLAASIANRCKKIFDETPPPETGHYIKVAPEIHAEIFGVLSQAAGLKKLLCTPNAQLRNESRRVYRLRRKLQSETEQILERLRLVGLVEAGKDPGGMLVILGPG